MMLGEAIGFRGLGGGETAWGPGNWVDVALLGSYWGPIRQRPGGRRSQAASRREPGPPIGVLFVVLGGYWGLFGSVWGLFRSVWGLFGVCLGLFGVCLGLFG